MRTAKSADVLSSAYLDSTASKTDLTKRLRAVHTALSATDVEVNSPLYPGLDSLAATLVSPKFLKHKDKDVRLYTSLCCIEIFYLFAPEPPWDASEILRVFEQIINQVSNLAHCVSSQQANYNLYFHILEQLANVKIGVVLVELFRQGGEQNATEMLASLVRALLTLVNKDHQQEVMSHAVTAIAACIDEFDSTIPVQLLDEILMCVSRGPTPSVIEASEENNTTALAATPSYMCAYNVIKRCEDRLSSPIANVLNGLLNNDTRFIADTQISQDAVWGIVFELHRIAPSLLTTVIGNVASALHLEVAEKRLRVVKLLGRLFYAPTSDVGVKFASCFRMWSLRVNDVDLNIRKQMARCLVKILENKPELRELAKESLIRMLEDPSSEIRIEVVHNVCDLASEDPTKIADDLLRAVGERVSSKSKTERKDAATGMSQIYQMWYSKMKLGKINADENCPISTVVEVAMNQEDKKTIKFHEPLAWIPGQVLTALCVNDSQDSDFRSRIIQIIDDVLLPKSLSITARATGLAMIVNEIIVDSNAYKWLGKFLEDRAAGQKALMDYLVLREEAKTFPANSGEGMTLNAEAEEKLEVLVKKFVPFTGGGPDASVNFKSQTEVMSKVHNHKDKHIFKLMQSIADCNHSSEARTRALDELPKRVSTLGASASAWMKTLVRRVSMGSAFCFDTISHCAMLAQEAASSEEYPTSALFLDIVMLGVTAFPSIGSGNNGECFNTLTEFFGEVRQLTGKAKKECDRENIMSSLSKIMAVVAPAANANNVLSPAGKSPKKGKGSKKKVEKKHEDNEELQSQLLKLCVKDGTPDQARNAIFVFAAMVKKDEKGAEEKAFSGLLKALTAPQRLAVDNERCVSILAALAALSEADPVAFESAAGVKAIRFALESVLLGKRGASILAVEGDDKDDDEEDDDEEDSDDGDSDSDSEGDDDTKTTKSKKSKTKKTKTKVDKKKVGKISESGLAGERVVRAIELLVAHIRSLPKHVPTIKSNSSLPELGENPSDVNGIEHVKAVFGVLVRILEDKGLPQSTRDAKLCANDVKSKAALRQAAGIGLLKMCDPAGGRDCFLDVAGWHALGTVFSDGDVNVRIACVEMLSQMITGSGAFGKVAPPLRFLSFVVFCVDTEHGSSTAVNGGAINIGKKTSIIKSAALTCSKNLRSTSETALLQCKARGPQGVSYFENNLKPMFMPEYSLPFALQLLAHRKETPFEKDSEAAYSQLKKRFKFLIEPIISSLGANADNIGFLLRVTELVGNSFESVPYETQSLTKEEVDDRLGVVCRCAREVLLKAVKTDSNLKPFAGAVKLPASLFQKRKTETEMDIKENDAKVALEPDSDYDDEFGDDDGGGDFEDEPSMIKMNATAEDSMASPAASKHPKASTWSGISPIAAKAQVLGVSKSKSNIRAVVASPKLAKPVIAIKVNRLNSSQSSNSSMSTSITASPKTKGRGGKRAAPPQDTSFDFFEDENKPAEKKVKKAPVKKNEIAAQTVEADAAKIAAQSNSRASRASRIR